MKWRRFNEKWSKFKFGKKNWNKRFEGCKRTKKKENPIQAEVNKIVSDLKGDSEEENIVSDLFYKSVKSFFDLGFELADKLNLELLSSFKLDEKKKRE